MDTIANAFHNRFLERKTRVIDKHPVITRNPFTKNLPLGRVNPIHILTPPQMRYSIMQWLAFSNEFAAIEAAHMVNAPTKKARRTARNILGNEIGVSIDMETGEIGGNKFSHNFAHVEWIEEIAELLDIDTTELNYWDRAGEKTRRFLTMLYESYSSKNRWKGFGASFAVETWAGYGIGKGEKEDAENFWSEELVGLWLFNKTHREPYGLPILPDKFFNFHKRLERSHVLNVEIPLDEIIIHPDFNEEEFFWGAKHALDGVYLFFEGREGHRVSTGKENRNTIYAVTYRNEEYKQTKSDDIPFDQA